MLDAIDATEIENPFALDAPVVSSARSQPTARPRASRSPATDPFANEDFTPEQLQARSLHVFVLKQFLHRQSAMLTTGVVPIALIVVFGIVLLVRIAREGTGWFSGSGSIPILSLLAGFLALGAYALTYVFRRFMSFPHDLTVDASGLIWTTNRESRRIAWSNVTHVWRSEMVINGDWLSNLTIELEDGTRLALDHSLSDYKELAAKIGISEQNLSLLKSGKVQGVRFRTLAAICQALDCQPGDILEFRED